LIAGAIVRTRPEAILTSLSALPAPAKGVLRAVVLAGVCVTTSPCLDGATSRATGLSYQTRTVPGAPARAGDRIRSCPAGPVDNYLSERWQQCWFNGPHGRWRTLEHHLHYYTLVVEVEAASLADADDIARRFVDLHKEQFSEIMLYVQAASAPATSLIRRVRWTKGTRFESLEFVGSLRR
jgi:hypothetical protein